MSTDDLCGLGFLRIPYGQEEIRALVRPSIDRVHLRRGVVVKLSRRSIIEVGMLAYEHPSVLFADADTSGKGTIVTRLILNSPWIMKLGGSRNWRSRVEHNMTANKYVYDAGSGSFHRKRKERPRADDSSSEASSEASSEPAAPARRRIRTRLANVGGRPAKKYRCGTCRRSLLRVEYGRNRAHRGQECTDCAAAAASAGTKVCRGCLRAKPKDDFTLTEYRRKHPLCAECARKQRTTGAVRLQPSRRKS